MSASGNGPARAQTSPLGLRALHALIFLGFCASAVAGMLTELRQLFEGLLYPWHCGTPPFALGAAAAVVALGAAAGLVGCLCLSRSAPLWVSALVLVAFSVSIAGQGFEFSRRSPPGANLAMLEVGKALHQRLQARLQESGAVPQDLAAWESALAAVLAERDSRQSPYRRRFFTAVPWRVELLAREGDFLTESAPGTFSVWIPPDASRFTITMVGLDADHHPARLRDDRGEVLEFKGAYAPVPQ